MSRYVGPETSVHGCSCRRLITNASLGLGYRPRPLSHIFDRSSKIGTVPEARGTTQILLYWPLCLAGDWRVPATFRRSADNGL